ncbi:MAG: prepilin peptidase, partial [Candidatus Binataceae bacterium]
MPAELPRALIGLFAFIFGASIGSFVNVLAYRIPREISILRPGSFCPQCRAAIPFWANVPLIAWIALRARCVKCHAPIPFRYFLTELIIALEGLYLFLSYAPADAFARLILCAALFAVALIDYDWRVIPSAITLGGIPIGFIAAAFMITEAGWLSSLIGIAAGAGFLFITGELYLRLRHQEGVGLGDVFLMGMIGAFLGWQ